MDLLDMIAINVVREGAQNGRKVPAKVVASAIGLCEGSASRRMRALRKMGVLPAKQKAKPRVPLDPVEKARRAAQRERRRRVLERQARP